MALGTRQTNFQVKIHPFEQCAQECVKRRY